MPVTTSDIVQDELKRLHAITGASWRNIAKKDAYKPIPAGTLASIAKGKTIPRKWLSRLGLPVPSSVISLNGSIPDGSQSLGALFCVKCDRPFIPNHPRRRKCFSCSKPRKRAA